MDHDRLFKELLTSFFAEFIELFLPEVAEQLERQSIQFLDKEIFTDINSGDRHAVDLLARVRLRDGEACILIHVENQSVWQADFPQRMFQYFSLIQGKHRLPTYPIALFSYDRPIAAAPNYYAVTLFDLPVLRFQFQTIQLNTLNWRQFLGTPNPVASALMVKMEIATQDRPRVKLECLRMLATLKLDPARSEIIGVFMNSYLRLTAAELIVYNQAFQALVPEEKEPVMRISNEWTDMGIEIGLERGLEQGLEQGLAKGRVEGRVEGLVEGRVETVSRQLRRRFGELPSNLLDALGNLTAAQLDDFAEALLDFNSLSDANAWISRV